MLRKRVKALDSRQLSGIVSVAGVFSLYLLTMAPTVQSFDSAELTVGAYTLGFVHAPGYPLYMLLGHAFIRWLPFGDPGTRLNLMSAVFASLTVLVLLRTVQNRYHALFAVPVVWMFATIPIFWSQALRAEVYTLHLFLITCVLYLWRRAHKTERPAPYLLCFALLGLAMTNHSTAVLLWGTLLISLLWESPRFRRTGLIGTALGVLVFGLLYLYFPLQSGSTTSVDYIRTYFDVELDSLTGVWWLFSAKMFQHAFYFDREIALVLRELSRFGALLWTSFLGVGVLLGFFGWRRLGQRDALWNRVLSIYFAVNLIAFVGYHVVDKEVMFIPALVVWAIWMVAGVNVFGDWLGKQTNGLAEKHVSVGVAGALLLLVGLGAAFNGPGVSLHNNQRAYGFSVQLLNDVEPSALVVNRWATASVLDYLRIVEGRRPDVESFNLDFYNLALQERYGTPGSTAAQDEWYSWLERQLAQRPLCFIEPLPTVPDRYQWARKGTCWKPISVTSN